MPNQQMSITYHLPVYRVQIVRDAHHVAPTDAIRGPADVATIATSYFDGIDREAVLVLLLNTKNHILNPPVATGDTVVGLNLVSLGTLDSAPIHPREVFRSAIMACAASIIVVHNHPSGDPTPSPEDISVTRRLREAGELLGIDVLDHVIITHDPNRYTSLRERGLL